MLPQPLTTARLILRRWRESDSGPFAALNADPEVMRYFPATLGERATRELISRIEAGFGERGYGLWALERRDTAEFIGFTGVNPMPDGIPGAGGVEVGWRLARAHWRQGFAGEAARAVLGLAFATPGPVPQPDGSRAVDAPAAGGAGIPGLGLAEVNSITAETNLPSRAVMTSLGMSYVEAFDHPGVAESSPLRRHVRYVIDRAAWAARN